MQVSAPSDPFLRSAPWWIALALLTAWPAHPAANARIDLAPFGHTSLVEPRALTQPLRLPNALPIELSVGSALQVEWNHPRDVRFVVLEFAGPAPAPDDLAVSWWRRIWPDNGTGGWMKLDDPFNGRWTRVKTVPQPAGPSALRLDFAPLDAQEAPGVKRTGFRDRHTYKIRVSSVHPVKVTRLSLFSDAVERHARLRSPGLAIHRPGGWRGRPRRSDATSRRASPNRSPPRPWSACGMAPGCLLCRRAPTR